MKALEREASRQSIDHKRQKVKAPRTEVSWNAVSLAQQVFKEANAPKAMFHRRSFIKGGMYVLEMMEAEKKRRKIVG
jgi:hypothetical protein